VSKSEYTLTHKRLPLGEAFLDTFLYTSPLLCYTF
jgi:hypothetical protein